MRSCKISDCELLMVISPCLLVSLSPCLLVSLSPCLLVSLSPCLLVSLSPCLPLPFGNTSGERVAPLATTALYPRNAVAYHPPISPSPHLPPLPIPLLTSQYKISASGKRSAIALSKNVRNSFMVSL